MSHNLQKENWSALLFSNIFHSILVIFSSQCQNCHNQAIDDVKELEPRF